MSSTGAAARTSSQMPVPSSAAQIPAPVAPSVAAQTPAQMAACPPPLVSPSELSESHAVQLAKMIKKDRMSSLFTTILLGGCILALVYRLKMVDERINSISVGLKKAPEEPNNRFKPVARRPPPPRREEEEEDETDEEESDDDVVVEVERSSPPPPPRSSKDPEEAVAPPEGNAPSDDEEEEEEAPPNVKSVQFVDRKRGARRTNTK
ncbi:MAG: hypothetical protein CBC65_001515 [Rhodothermaceae bacterium TMED105]|nr:MAG: hypothetical protein CBC65_001515 [Rhodothermaceae bacterium TMED105]